MTKILKSIAGTALAMIAGAAAPASEWTNQSPEKTFVFRNTPIHPVCVVKIEELRAGRDRDFDLEKCVMDERPLPPVHVAAARVSTEYKRDGLSIWADYNVLANRGTEYLIALTESGGGTGVFDSLDLVRLDGNKLVREEVLTWGDRCNGGLGGHKLNGHLLRYSVNLTPAELIAHAGETDFAKASKFGAGAISCVATEDFEYDLDTRSKRRVSITFTGEWYTKRPDEQQNKLLDGDDCFSRTYNAYVERGQLMLKGSEITRFMRITEEACKR